MPLLLFVLCLVLVTSVLITMYLRSRSSQRLPKIDCYPSTVEPTAQQLAAVSAVYERALTEGATYLHTKMAAQDLLAETEPDWQAQVMPIIDDCEEAIRYLDDVLAQTRWLTYDKQSLLAQTITMLSMLIRGHEQILRALQHRTTADLDGAPDMDSITQLTARIHKARTYV